MVDPKAQYPLRSSIYYFFLMHYLSYKEVGHHDLKTYESNQGFTVDLEIDLILEQIISREDPESETDIRYTIMALAKIAWFFPEIWEKHIEPLAIQLSNLPADNESEKANLRQQLSKAITHLIENNELLSKMENMQQLLSNINIVPYLIMICVKSNQLMLDIANQAIFDILKIENLVSADNQHVLDILANILKDSHENSHEKQEVYQAITQYLEQQLSQQLPCTSSLTSPTMEFAESSQQHIPKKSSEVSEKIVGSIQGWFACHDRQTIENDPELKALETIFPYSALDLYQYFLTCIYDCENCKVKLPTMKDYNEATAIECNEFCSFDLNSFGVKFATMPSTKDTPLTEELQRLMDGISQIAVYYPNDWNKIKSSIQEILNLSTTQLPQKRAYESAALDKIQQLIKNDEELSKAKEVNKLLEEGNKSKIIGILLTLVSQEQEMIDLINQSLGREHFISANDQHLLSIITHIIINGEDSEDYINQYLTQKPLLHPTCLPSFLRDQTASSENSTPEELLSEASIVIIESMKEWIWQNSTLEQKDPEFKALAEILKQTTSKTTSQPLISGHEPYLN